CGCCFRRGGLVCRCCFRGCTSCLFGGLFGGERFGFGGLTSCLLFGRACCFRRGGLCCRFRCFGVVLVGLQRTFALLEGDDDRVRSRVMGSKAQQPSCRLDVVGRAPRELARLQR